MVGTPAAQVIEKALRRDFGLDQPIFVQYVRWAWKYVPGSHYSGRTPKDQENPEFDGNGPYRYSAGRATTSTYKTRCAGIAVRRIPPTAHATSFSRSTPPVGRTHASTCTTAFR